MEKEEEEEEDRTIFERNKFFATTGLAGFGFISSSNSKAETTIWYVVIAMFILFTVRDIFILSWEYQHQVPVTSVQMERWDGQIENAYLVMIIDNIHFLYDEFYENNESYPFPYAFDRSLDTDLNQLIGQLDSKEKIVGYNATWSYMLLSLLTPYVKLMSTMEGYGTKQSLERFHTKSIYPFIKRFLGHCQQLNVTNQELVNKWFSEYMQMILVTVEDKDKELPIPLQLTNVYVILSDNKFFLNIEIGRPLTLPYEMKLTTRNLNQALLESGVFGEHATLDYMSHLGRNVMINVYFFVGNEGISGVGAFHTDNGQYVGREVKMVYSFESLSKSCTDITKYQCHRQCLSAHVIDNCHCTPLFSTEYYDNLTPCSIDVYEKCEKSRSTCNYRECPDKCEQKIISFDSEFENKRSQDNESAGFYLFEKPTSYPIFTEMYAMSAANFWASLGGIFDFWVGANVLCIVHLSVYMSKQFAYIFKKETKTGRKWRLLMNGMRKNKHDQNQQMVDLLTMGIAQQGVKRQIPEKEQTLTEQIELVKNDTKQQGKQIEVLQEKITEKMEKMAENQENMSAEIKSIVEQVAEQQKSMAQQMEIMKDLAQQMNKQELHIGSKPRSDPDPVYNG